MAKSKGPYIEKLVDEMCEKEGGLGRRQELATTASRDNESYAKMELEDGDNPHITQVLYVKGSWYPTHFLLCVLDGHDTWTMSATEAFVTQCASEWDTGVEEWMDQVQTHFSQQHPESSYAFISVGDDIKMLQCSIYNEAWYERRVVRLRLERTNRPEVAFDMLGGLVHTAAKQNDELARKTRELHRMAAEIRELRSNSEGHLRLEHGCYLVNTSVYNRPPYVTGRQGTETRRQSFSPPGTQESPRAQSRRSSAGGKNWGNVRLSVHDTSSREPLSNAVETPGVSDSRRSSFTSRTSQVTVEETSTDKDPSKTEKNSQTRRLSQIAPKHKIAEVNDGKTIVEADKQGPDTSGSDQENDARNSSYVTPRHSIAEVVSYETIIMDIPTPEMDKESRKSSYATARRYSMEDRWSPKEPSLDNQYNPRESMSDSQLLSSPPPSMVHKASPTAIDNDSRPRKQSYNMSQETSINENEIQIRRLAYVTPTESTASNPERKGEGTPKLELENESIPSTYWNSTYLETDAEGDSTSMEPTTSRIEMQARRSHDTPTTSTVTDDIYKRRSLHAHYQPQLGEFNRSTDEEQSRQKPEMLVSSSTGALLEGNSIEPANVSGDDGSRRPSFLRLDNGELVGTAVYESAFTDPGRVNIIQRATSFRPALIYGNPVTGYRSDDVARTANNESSRQPSYVTPEIIKQDYVHEETHESPTPTSIRLHDESEEPISDQVISKMSSSFEPKRASSINQEEVLWSPPTQTSSRRSSVTSQEEMLRPPPPQTNVSSSRRPSFSKEEGVIQAPATQRSGSSSQRPSITKEEGVFQTTATQTSGSSSRRSSLIKQDGVIQQPTMQASRPNSRKSSFTKDEEVLDSPSISKTELFKASQEISLHNADPSTHIKPPNPRSPRSPPYIKLEVRSNVHKEIVNKFMVGSWESITLKRPSTNGPEIQAVVQCVRNTLGSRGNQATSSRSPIPNRSEDQHFQAVTHSRIESTDGMKNPTTSLSGLSLSQQYFKQANNNTDDETEEDETVSCMADIRFLFPGNTSIAQAAVAGTNHEDGHMAHPKPSRDGSPTVESSEEGSTQRPLQCPWCPRCLSQSGDQTSIQPPESTK